MNSITSEVTEWAQHRLRQHHRTKEEQKELQHQISLMESEGNINQGA